MVKWECPRCGTDMYSAYDKKKDKKVKCIICYKKFDNPYYRKEEKNER